MSEIRSDIPYLPFNSQAGRIPALLRLTQLRRVPRGRPHREGVGETTPSAQLRHRPAGDNRGVTDYVEFTSAGGQLVCRCRVATSFAARFRGLMGVAQLAPGSGLLLPGTNSVHTHFMRFPIDVVFLDSGRRIVSLVTTLGPWRLATEKTATSVLELAGGECERLGLAEGDVLREVAPS
jgi:uncharacterized membrane protein (UPF0127 family)